jgi:hypothetical protein
MPAKETPTATPDCYSEGVDDMHHPRLHSRSGTWYFKAKYPVDLRHLFTADTRWTSLRTKDKRAAIKRIKAMDLAFDAEMQERRKDASPPAAQRRTLSPEEMRGILDGYLAELLGEDEDRRSEAFRDEQRDAVRAAIWRQLSDRA